MVFVPRSGLPEKQLCLAFSIFLASSLSLTASADTMLTQQPLNTGSYTLQDSGVITVGTDIIQSRADGSGGRIDMTAGKLILLNPGRTLDVSATRSGQSGGIINLSAPAMLINGMLRANGMGNGRGGSINLNSLPSALSEKSIIHIGNTAVLEAKGGESGGLGGTITISGVDNTAIQVDAGARLETSGKTATDANRIVIQGQGQADDPTAIMFAGKAIADSPTGSQAGIIRFVSDTGDIRLEKTAGLSARTMGAASSGNITVSAEGALIHEGLIDASAQGEQSHGGHIYLGGETVEQRGVILANGGNDGKGGKIEITSREKTVLETNSFTAARGAGARSDAGEIRIWSDKDTDFNPLAFIDVRGGTVSGDGGFAEVSGRQTVKFEGIAIGGSQQGNSGTILIDPTDIELGPSDLYFPGFRDNLMPMPDIAFTDFNGEPIQISLEDYGVEVFNSFRDIYLQATNDITISLLFDTSLAAAKKGGTLPVNLKLEANNNINIYAPLVTHNASIELIADADNNNAGGIYTKDTITSNGGNITLKGAQMVLNERVDAGTGTLRIMPSTIKDIYVANPNMENDAGNRFDLSQPEMDLLSAQTVIIGETGTNMSSRTDSGLTLDGNLSLNSNYNLSLRHQGYFSSFNRRIQQNSKLLDIDVDGAATITVTQKNTPTSLNSITAGTNVAVTSNNGLRTSPITFSGNVKAKAGNINLESSSDSIWVKGSIISEATAANTYVTLGQYDTLSSFNADGTISIAPGSTKNISAIINAGNLFTNAFFSQSNPLFQDVSLQNIGGANTPMTLGNFQSVRTFLATTSGSNSNITVKGPINASNNITLTASGTGSSILSTASGNIVTGKNISLTGRDAIGSSAVPLALRLINDGKLTARVTNGGMWLTSDRPISVTSVTNTSPSGTTSLVSTGGAITGNLNKVVTDISSSGTGDVFLSATDSLGTAYINARFSVTGNATAIANGKDPVSGDSLHLYGKVTGNLTATNLATGNTTGDIILGEWENTKTLTVTGTSTFKSAADVLGYGTFTGALYGNGSRISFYQLGTTNLKVGDISATAVGNTANELFTGYKNVLNVYVPDASILDDGDVSAVDLSAPNGAITLLAGDNTSASKATSAIQLGVSAGGDAYLWAGGKNTSGKSIDIQTGNVTGSIDAVNSIYGKTTGDISIALSSGNLKTRDIGSAANINLLAANGSILQQNDYNFARNMTVYATGNATLQAGDSSNDTGSYVDTGVYVQGNAFLLASGKNSAGTSVKAVGLVSGAVTVKNESGGAVPGHVYLGTSLGDPDFLGDVDTVFDNVGNLTVNALGDIYLYGSPASGGKLSLSGKTVTIRQDSGNTTISNITTTASFGTAVDIFNYANQAIQGDQSGLFNIITSGKSGIVLRAGNLYPSDANAYINNLSVLSGGPLTAYVAGSSNGSSSGVSVNISGQVNGEKKAYNESGNAPPRGTVSLP